MVYPPYYDFIFFRVFRLIKIFLINISMNPIKTHTYSIGPHVDAVGPALGGQSVLQVYPLVSWL